MKMIRNIAAIGLTAALLAGPLAGVAAEKKPEVKPYKLDKCIVSDEKLGEMGKPFVFEYKGQEIKLCCKHCKRDFDKDPAKYLKKMAEAEKSKTAPKPGAGAAHDGSQHTH